jgi:hypothetical protein
VDFGQVGAKITLGSEWGGDWGWVARFADDGAGFEHQGGGVWLRLRWKVFKVVDRPWKMCFVGVLFGLGFDASS